VRPEERGLPLLYELWVNLIHLFPGRSHTNTNNVFRLVNPVSDRSMFIFKVTVFMTRAGYE